ncbi:response regulator [Desulfoluna spongiiphila]|uniref:histidine kinase n=1 Tax=Desulfoluna spongiiphila TaxID=419481 RepID=A0A1G5EPN0_9BACT|nr:response regulator [Desulfoluna spongiiphila]SCY28967.1 Signal transduction histidine kinase [Desulfoluna spongiiphila]
MKLALKYKLILYVYATLPLAALWLAARANTIHAMPAFQHALTVGILTAFGLPLAAPWLPGFRWLIQRQVTRISRFCARVKQGTYIGFRLPPETEDENEIIALMRDLNWMLRIIEVREAELERRVARRTGELNQARLAAEASVQAKGAFLANISHEIRTPINAIMGMADVLLAQPDSPTAPDNLRIIAAASRNLLLMVNEILDYSKMEAGKLELEAIPFRLRDLMEGVTDTLSQQAQEKSLELVCDIDASVPQTLVGDPTRLGQIITNLTANAIRFTEAGEVVVTARFHRETLESGNLSLCVLDTGEGIPEAVLPTLFDAFTQADGSITRHHGGTGLGLAICRKLSAMMDGTLTVASTSGRGSEFTLSCPLNAPYESSEAFLYGVDMKPRCLVVEDNRSARRVLSGFLDDFDFPHDLAGSVREAVEALTQARGAYRLLLADVTLPPGEGALLIRHLQAMEEGNRPGVILLSPLNHRDAAWHRGLDIAGHVVKPVKQSALYNAIVSALAPVSAPEAPSETSGEAVHRQRVLVVEDNPFNRKVAEEILGAARFQVRCTANGQEALDLLGKNSFDLVLADMQMPGMDGCELTETIRSSEGLRDLPVVMLTADADPGTRRAAMASGASGFLTKPVAPGELLRVLEGQLIADARDVSQEDVNPDERPGFEALAAALGGDPTRAAELVMDFVEAFGKSPATIADTLAGETPDEAQALLHTLKGAAANLYCRELAEAASAMETAVKRGQFEEAGGGVATLERCLADLAREGDCLVSTGGHPEGAEPHRGLPLESLRELEALITTRNIMARAKAQALLEPLSHAGFRAQAEQLVACLRKYNFKDAKGLLTQIFAAGSATYPKAITGE